MTLQEIAATATERTVKEFVYRIGRTPDERLAWNPCETSRTVLHIAAECAIVTEIWSDILASGICPPAEEYFRPLSRLDDFTTREQVVSALETATSRLAAVLRQIPDERLSDDLTVFWGESAPLAAWLHWVAIHTSYHLGQINYIQRLYGDTQD